MAQSTDCHSQFVAMLNQACPNPLEDAEFAPLLEVAVDGSVVAKLGGELVPLATAPQTEDDAVEHLPQIHTVLPLTHEGIMNVEDGLD
jgi:hypothetical protein